MKALLTFIAIALLAPAAQAGTWQHGCSTTNAGRSSTTVEQNERACYEMVSGETAANGDSDAFTISALSALICFNPDIGGTTTNTGRVTPRYCQHGIKPAADPEQQCISLGELDGTEGAASVQNACVRVGPGVYYIDVTADIAADARVSIQAEEPNP